MMNGKPNLIEGPATQNFSNRPADTEVDMIIVHSMAEQIRKGGSICTAADMLTLKQPPDTWTEDWGRVSAHYYITPSGNIHRVLSPAMKAWHAGKSAYMGRGDLNNNSIGFELLVPGVHDYNSFLTAILTDIYTPAQYKAAGYLCARLMMQYNIGMELIKGHSEVSGPTVRDDPKKDPGPGFRWRELYGWTTFYLVREPTDEV
jgi:N-acetyl-anhydromuramyl-L-alanine amidase AmpD